MDKVLIADDDVQLLLILRETLKKYRDRFEIHTVKDGLAAIKAMQKEPFALVVTDIQRSCAVVLYGQKFPQNSLHYYDGPWDTGFEETNGTRVLTLH